LLFPPEIRNRYEFESLRRLLCVLCASVVKRLEDSRQRTIVDHLLIRAARGESVQRPPVWAMRQAGRWDPKFHALRQGMGFYEFSENVELSIECSLLPQRFGVDAIILFYDITTLPVAMGQPFNR